MKNKLVLKHFVIFGMILSLYLVGSSLLMAQETEAAPQEETETQEEELDTTQTLEEIAKEQKAKLELAQSSEGESDTLSIPEIPTEMLGSDSFSKSFHFTVGFNWARMSKNDEFHDYFKNVLPDDYDDDDCENCRSSKKGSQSKFLQLGSDSKKIDLDGDKDDGIGSPFGGGFNLGLDYFFLRGDSMKLGLGAELSAYGRAFGGRNKADNYKGYGGEAIANYIMNFTALFSLTDSNNIKLGLSGGLGVSNYYYKVKFRKIDSDLSSDYIDSDDEDKKNSYSGESQGYIYQGNVYTDFMNWNHGIQVGLFYFETTHEKVDLGKNELKLALLGQGLFLRYRYAF